MLIVKQTKCFNGLRIKRQRYEPDWRGKTVAYQSIGVQEDTLGVLGQAPAMQLREGHTKLGSTQQFQVVGIIAVYDVDVN